MRNYPDELADSEERNAALKIENTALKKRVGVLEAENAELRGSHAPAPPAVTEEASQILQAIAQSPRGTTGPALLSRFQVTQGQLDRLLDILVAHTFITEDRVVPHEGIVWIALPPGRQHLDERGLL
jgi:DNA-binding MarR family transcriptional regulator